MIHDPMYYWLCSVQTNITNVNMNWKSKLWNRCAEEKLIRWRTQRTRLTMMPTTDDEKCNSLEIYYLAVCWSLVLWMCVLLLANKCETMSCARIFVPSRHRRYLHTGFPYHRTLLERQTNARFASTNSEKRLIFLSCFAMPDETQRRTVVLLFICCWCWSTNNKCHKTEIECVLGAVRCHNKRHIHIKHTHTTLTALHQWTERVNEKIIQRERKRQKNKNNGKPRE